MITNGYPGLMDALNCGVIVIGEDGRITVWNSWIAERSGIRRARAVGATLPELFPGLDGSRLVKAVDMALRSGLSTILSHNLHPHPLPLFSVRPGSVMQVKAHTPIEQSTVIRPIRDSEDNPGCLVQVSDVTATVIRESRLREMADYARSLLEASIDPFITIDRNGTIIDVNDAAARVVGLEREALIGTGFVDCFTQPEKAATGLELALQEGGVRDFPLSIRNGSDVVTDLHFHISTYRNRTGEIEGMLAAGRDITHQKAAERELFRLATTDTLTGASNRRHFMELAEREVLRTVRYQRPASLVSIDADHFKSINDTYGHAAGDEVLRRLVALWRTQLRDADIIGRVGGEEFLILLPETGEQDAFAAAERLRAAVSKMLIHSHGQSFQVTVSIGVAEIGKAEPLQRALARVDAALYAAKQSGRNTVRKAPPQGTEVQFLRGPMPMVGQS